MSTIHLITTCAKKKAGPVHDTVFPYHTTDTEIAYQQWKSLVQSRFTTCNDDIKETESMVTPVFATPILTTSWLA